MARSLEELLAPVAFADFVDGYWERCPLLLTGREPERNNWLGFSIRELDDLILSASRGERALQIGRLLPDGGKIQQFVPEGRGLWATAVEAYRTGHTLVFFALEQSIPWLKPFFTTVESELSSSVSGTLYASPSGASQGFRTHWDHDDVYVLHLEGQKRWRVWKPIEELSLGAAQLEASAADALGEPVMDVWLEPGDLLYIPHGWIHGAISGEKPSLHFSLVPDACPWQDLLMEAVLQATTRLLECRRSLPPGFLHGDRSGLRREFHSNLERTLKAMDFDAAFSKVSRHVVGAMLGKADGHFLRIENRECVALETLLKKRYSHVCSLNREGDGTRLVLTFPCNELELPLSVEAALQHIISCNKISPQELPLDVNNEAKLQFCKDLIAAGFLVEAE